MDTEIHSQVHTHRDICSRIHTHRETQGHTYENTWELMGIFTQEHTKMIEDTQGYTGNIHRDS